MTTFHIVRRSIEAVGTLSKRQDGEPNDGEEPLSAIALLIMWLTAMAFLFLLFCISYTYGHLIPTLCMVESPETTAYMPVDAMRTEPPAYEEEDDSAPKTNDPEILLVQNKPVTASLRATILHLRARAGYWSQFRGLTLYIIWNFCVGLITSLLAPLFGYNRLFIGLAAILAQLVAARIHMTWIHVVISEPSPKRWYQRVPPFKTWTKIAPAVALWALSTQITTVLPWLVSGSFGSLKHMKNPEYNPDRKDLYAVGAQGFFGMFLMLALYIALQIPATVTMVRVAASMLPEEDETIVSFDRTFGGKTTPTIIGGQGKIGLVEAWRSFPWASRMRLLRLVGKVAVLAMVVWIGMIITLTIEAHIMLGDNLGHVMKAIHGAAGPR